MKSASSKAAGAYSKLVFLCVQSENTAKFRELQKREGIIDSFMGTYDDVSSRELQQTDQLQEAIVVLLEQISKSLTSSANLPTKDELKALKVVPIKSWMPQFLEFFLWILPFPPEFICTYRISSVLVLKLLRVCFILHYKRTSLELC